MFHRALRSLTLAGVALSPLFASDSEPTSPAAIAPVVRTQPEPHPAGRFVRNLVADQKTIWTAPFHMSRRQWLTHALPLVGGTALLLAQDHRISTSLTSRERGVLWAGRVSQAGAFYTLAGASSVTMLLGKSAESSQAAGIGRTAAEALANASLLTAGLKLAFGRERPAHNMDGRFLKGKDSFPSGHAMTSWAVATAVARHRKTPRWLAVTSYAAAAAISLSRVGARRHFASDIFAGSVLGVMVGNYVVHRTR